MTQPVTLNITDGIAQLQLNRPAEANTINMPLAEALLGAATRLQAADDVRAVVLSGAGARFCGGGDIGAFMEAPDQQQFLSDLATAADTAVQVLESLPIPIVAAVHGAVAGGGLGIMLAADVVVAAGDTKFVFAYPDIGITPDCGASASLERAMGSHRALAFALSGAAIFADQAQAQGLVTEVAADPLARALQIAQSWSARAAGALGATRLLMRQNAQLPRAEVGQREAVSIGDRMMSAEAQRLVEQFFSR